MIRLKMSFGGKDDRDSKRKHQWSAYNRGAKRFHGLSESPREQFPRGIGSRWDRGPRPQESFSKSHRSPGNYSWAPNFERTNYNRFPHPTNNKNYNQIFEFQSSVSSGPLKESEELVGPGSELERMEKVLATKKRIEEALASKSSDSNNKEINFQNASSSSGGKSKEKESHGPNLDLRLTNSDFKEIGSVASGISTEGDMETSDYTINDIQNVTVHISQQRSFDNTTLNSTPNVQALQQKSQKVGGWSMSAVNDIVSKPNNSCPIRPRGDMYLQEPREEILGNVSTAITGSTSTVDPSPSKQSYDNQNYRNEFSRVGRLYQSFLKSRLFGYTLKVKDKSQKLTRPNPLLDKSVLDSHGSDRAVTTDDQVLELQMPQPIRIKMDDDDSEHTSEQIAAEEANEFCKEFSFLLKDPDFLIPPDHLEKLGLGHLREMNKLINDKRIHGTSGSSIENQDRAHQKRNLDALNSVTENNDVVNINTETIPFSISDNVGRRGSIDRFKERDCLLSNENSNHDSSSTLRSQDSPHLDQTIRPDILRRENTVSTQSPQVSSFHNVSVEAVVEKVVKTILQPSNINSVLNSNISSTVDAHINLTKNTNGGHLPGQPGTSFSDVNNTPLNQMQNVSSKILRMFLIDKQVEELMAEKMKIYGELLSSEGVSQTLFHSWAEDQIQQGNVMNVITSTSNIIPELDRVINQNVQETNPLLNVQLEETISELYCLKKEYENANMTTPQAAEPSPCEPSMFPPDSCFLMPKDVVLEENRPKLSVRKDLLDPNRSNVSLLNTPVEMSAKSGDYANSSDCINSPDADKTTIKRDRKKKKCKTKEKLEVINLIEDTDDEISSGTGTGIESVGGLNSEDEVDKKVTGNLRISYELNTKTATCMATTRVKKTQTTVMVVGCKDGYIMGYVIGTPALSFTKKIHNDTIMAIFCIKKYLITGSLDSRICLFSLKDQVETQTLTVNASVQSMDINFGELIVGTKVGSIYSYTIKVEEVKKKAYVSLHPNKKALVCSDHKSSILAVKLAMEGACKVLIVASRGEQISVRDANNGLVLRVFDWCDTVFCLQLYEETPLVYCGTKNKSVKVVNYTDGLNASDCAIGRSITQIVFLYSVMFAASHDGNIYVYDVEKNSLMATVITSKGIIQCLAIDSRNGLILVATSRGDLQQIPFPTSVAKRLKKLKFEKKNCQNKTLVQP